MARETRDELRVHGSVTYIRRVAGCFFKYKIPESFHELVCSFVSMCNTVLTYRCLL